MASFSNATVNLSGNIPTVTNIDALRNYLPRNIRDGDSVIVSGQIEPGDQNGGVFVWQEGNTDADDGQTVVKPATSIAAGRWVLSIGRGVQGEVGPRGLQGDVGPQGQGLAEVMAPGGSALVGFKGRTVAARLNDTIDVRDYGAKGDGTTDDTAAIQAAAAAAGTQGTVFIPAGDYRTISKIDPSAGFTGPGLIWRDKGDGLGKQIVNRRGRDTSQKVLGREYLARLWNFLSRFGQAYKATTWMTGDSVTAGYVGPILNGFMSSVAGFGTITNNAISGSTIEQWRTGTASFTGSGKALSDWLAAPTDFLYIAFGINTPYYGGTAQDFADSLRKCLVSIRNLRDSTQTSIMIVLPIASRDGGAMGVESGFKRDEYFVSKLRALCEPLVDEFRVCIYDQSVETPAADVDSGTVNPNAIWLDSAGVHPIEGYRYFLAGQIFDVMVPIGLRSTLSSSNNGVANVTPAAGYTLGNAPEPLRITKKNGIAVSSGYVSLTTPAVINSGTIVATISAGYRPTDKQWWADLAIFYGEGFERVRGIVDHSTGEISVAQTTNQTASRVYLYATWVCD